MLLQMWRSNNYLSEISCTNFLAVVCAQRSVSTLYIADGPETASKERTPLDRLPQNFSYDNMLTSIQQVFICQRIYWQVERSFHSSDQYRQEAQLPLRNRASAMHFFVDKLLSNAVMSHSCIYHLRNLRPANLLRTEQINFSMRPQRVRMTRDPTVVWCLLSREPLRIPA